MKKSLLLAPIALVALALPVSAGQNKRVVADPVPVVVNSDGQLEITTAQHNSRTPQLYITQMGLLVSPQPQDPALLSFYEATQMYIEEVLPRLKARLDRWKSDADRDPALNRTGYLNDQLQGFLTQDGALARIDQIDASMVHTAPTYAIDIVAPSDRTDQAKAGSLGAIAGMDLGQQTVLRPHLEACGPNGSPMTQQQCCSLVCDPSGCHEWCNLCNCKTGGDGCCGYGL